MAATNSREALVEGLADAVGFVIGALAGWLLGRLLGFDVLASGEWGANAIIGWLLLLAGCGGGKWASNRWQKHRAAGRASKD